MVAPLLLHAITLQLITYAARPTASYRALDIGVSTSWLGLLSASFALVGALVLLTFAQSFTTLLIGVMLLGAGHLFSVIGEQAVVGNNSTAANSDRTFGRVIVKTCGCDTRSHRMSGLADWRVDLCRPRSPGPVLEACPHPDVRRW